MNQKAYDATKHHGFLLVGRPLLIDGWSRPVGFLLRIVLATALVNLAPAVAQAKNAVASPALQKEFDGFIEKFRAALKANDSAAVAGMTRLPFMNDNAIRDAAQFGAKTYRTSFTAKNRACIQRGKAVYDRDDYKNDSYFVFCGELIFVFTKTPTGFLFTDISVND
ncbi:hypothetical protein [Bradyrhizobium sp. SUTN9-2]|uniref:hypothetical protein n=1 Tax=Bradyrhizobium TaxID=374 RepID=UPI001FCEFE76|nr:hypothetical protein [Bradyrhizobium sp. SUTN9-2]